METVLWFAVVLLVLAVGERLATWSRAAIPSVFVSALLFLLGFWTILPADVVDRSGLGGRLSVLGLHLIVVHMGAMISGRELIAQWRVILTALAAIAGLSLVTLTAGAALFGTATALAATPPLAGGIVASLIMSEGAVARDLPHLAVLAAVMYVTQGFAGYPLTAWCLRRETRSVLRRIRQDGTGDTGTLPSSARPDAAQSPSDGSGPMELLARLGVVALLAAGLAHLTGGAVSPYVVCLLLGVAAAELGVLPRRPLEAAGGFGLVMAVLLAFIFAQLARATPAVLAEIAPALIGLIALGVLGLAGGAALIGRLAGLSLYRALAVSLTALYGFPPNYILTREAVESATPDPTERERLMAELLPGMLVGGFTTVTVVSVVLASLLVAWL